MHKPCIFLKETPHDGPVCRAGVNFYGVETDRAFCRICPVVAPDTQSMCPYAEISTWLRPIDGSARIVAEIVCNLDENDTPAAARCADCPGNTSDTVKLYAVLPGP